MATSIARPSVVGYTMKIPVRSPPCSLVLKLISALERARRVMRFNEDALANIAVRAVKGRECVSFEKVADGGAHQPLCVPVAHSMHRTD